MKIIIAILLILSCCTGTTKSKETFVTAHGIVVNTQGNPISINDIEIATETLSVCLEERFPEQYNRKDLFLSYIGTEVYVEKNYFECFVKLSDDTEPTTTTCAGLYTEKSGGRNEIKISHDDCIGSTSFVHELLHLVEDRFDNKISYGHDDKRFFGKNPGTLEYDVNHYLIKMNCPICIE